MNVAVYADVVFAVNLLMDCLILWIVGRISNKKIRWFRWIGGGLAMSLLYCLVIFTVPFRFMNQIVASLLILGIGLAIAFKPAGLKMFFRLMLLAYVVSFTVGGLGMVLFYLTDLPIAAGYLAATGGSEGGLSWKLTAVCVIISYALIKLGLRVLERVTLKRQQVCPLTISFDGSDVSLQALLDTGHTLRDPLTHAPVIVAEFESIKPFLPDALRLLFYENQENNLSGLLTEGDEHRFYSRIRMIPFISLGKQNGMLIGFKPDKVAFYIKQKELTRDDVVVGIYNRKLTANDRYQGLVGPEVMA